MLETGIPNLDLILGGGLPDGDTLLVTGPAGSGKSALALQMAFHRACLGENVVYVATLSESPAKLIQHFRHFSFFDEGLMGRRLLLAEVFPAIRDSLQRLLERLTKATQDHRARLLIIDGLDAVYDLYPQIYETNVFIYDLEATLAAMRTSLLITSTEAYQPHSQTHPELRMADGILELGRQDVDSYSARTIRVIKMRGMPHLLGQHTLHIDSSGLRIFPRAETVFRPGEVALRHGRLPTGLPGLDEMMGGGLAIGSTTLLAGSLGAGKTLACLHYLLEGARRGEKGLWLGLHESPAELIDKASAIGMDLRTPVSRGLVRFLHYPPIDVTPDRIVWEMYQTVQSFAPRRLVLDSIAVIEHALSHERHQQGFFASLVGILRQRGVTSLVVKELPQVVGREVDSSATPLAVLAENVVTMRFIDLRGELLRVLSVLKVRDRDHDRSIRPYLITPQGLKVMPPIKAGESALAGFAHLPVETRAERIGSKKRNRRKTVKREGGAR